MTAPAPRSADFVIGAGEHCLAATTVYAADGREPGILALHGLGETSTRHRVRYLLDPFAAAGYGSLTFDFSGNGDSTGVMAASTLRIRRAETLAAAAGLDPTERPVLLGTSMGAHLAASVVPQVRPRALVLFCPAAYPESAWDLRFDGSLTRPANHPDSPAYAGLREFDGDLLIVAGCLDQVVPAETIDGYLAHARRARSTQVIWLSDCDHFVHRWLPWQEARRAEIVNAIVRLLAAGAPASAQEASNVR
jgi:hypothetical protein